VRLAPTVRAEGKMPSGQLVGRRRYEPQYYPQ
jgi:hypothetical protein